jgi:putative peptidoglycan lipid II flippase
MTFVSVNTLLNRAFYSIRKSWLPLMVGAVNLALNALLDWALYRPLGVGGITLSTSLVSIFTFCALLLLLNPRIGGIDSRRIAWSAVRTILALIPLAGVAYGVWWALDSALGRDLWAEILSVGIAYVAGDAAYCLAAWALRVPEMHDFVRLIRRRREPRETETILDSEGGGQN